MRAVLAPYSRAYERKKSRLGKSSLLEISKKIPEQIGKFSYFGKDEIILRRRRTDGRRKKTEFAHNTEKYPRALRREGSVCHMSLIWRNDRYLR